jgi:hypothetical protein
MKRSRNTAFNLAIVLLSVVLLSQARPLWAKCAINSVRVHGKVQCTFKPDYKALITLIYSGHQREATGEETALDLRDGSFDGVVAFTTFVSYNPLTGHNCGRRPKGVIVRLIAADGTEWDRKELKIADAFGYNEEQGQYSVRTDLILHGWCEPKCADTSSTPCENQK